MSIVGDVPMVVRDLAASYPTCAEHSEIRLFKDILAKFNLSERFEQWQA